MMAHAEFEKFEDGEIHLTQKAEKWRLARRLVSCVMVVFFALCAYVQLNDPDPYVWIPIYVIPALLSISMAWSPDVTTHGIWKVICVIHIGICVVGSTYLLEVVAERQREGLHNPLQHEEGREVAGLLIVIAWLTMCAFSSFGSSSASWSSTWLLLLTCVLALLPPVVWSLCFLDGVGHKLGHCKDMFPGMLGRQWAHQR